MEIIVEQSGKTTVLKWQRSDGKQVTEIFCGTPDQQSKAVKERIDELKSKMSEPRYSQVIITSIDSTASRVLLAGSVGNLNDGVTTAAQGLLIPNPIPTTLPALTATAYFKDEQGVVTALSPQPTFHWELSCGSHQATIDQSGVITKHSNPDDQAFNSNGAATASGTDNAGIGSLVQVSATVVRKDGSLSGCIGFLNVALQNTAARQFGNGVTGAANNSPSARGYFNLVDPVTGEY